VNSKSKTNNQPEEFNLPHQSEVVDKLLDDLEALALNDAFATQTLLMNEYPPLKLGFSFPQGAYITEIEEQFYLLDYGREGFEPKPVPLNASNLAKSSPQSKISEVKNDNSVSSSAFLGKKGLLWGLALGILLTMGATRIFSAQTTGTKGEPTLVGESTAPAQTVTVTKVTTTEIDSTLSLSGTVSAYERTPVMSQAAGLQITDVLVERGDYVEQGQVLARLNNQVLSAEKVQEEGAISQAQARLSELKAGSRTEEIAQAESRVANAQSAIAQAESDLELVQKRVQRNTSLQADGAISRDRLDEILNQKRVAKSTLAGAKANLNEAKQGLAQLQAGSRPQTIAQAQAELDQAQGRLQAVEAQLGDTTIKAPRGGIIASREAKVGQTTSGSEMLFTIIQDGRLELRLQVPETLIGKIQSGQKVQITSNNNQNLELTGKVRKIDPLIDDSSRQATVYVDLPTDTSLKPGMFLQARVNTDTNQGEAVPIEALLPQSGNRAIAFVVQPDNTVKSQNVTIGEILPGQKVEIVEGLQPGDQIVLKGAAYLKDGDKVAISKDQVSSTK
jgi:HlyD family secretion protein